MPKILIVEDDATLVDVLTYNLKHEGYEVTSARDGVRGLELARQVKPDLVLLDVMMPGLDGYELCRILRKESATPILMLTAKADETDKIVGLELGADDYMTKPFSLRELLARIKAMLRRAGMADGKPGAEPALLKAGEVTIDAARRQAVKRGTPLALTRKEFDLLVFLASNKGLVFSREQLLEKVWGYDYTGETRTVDVHVRWLREKLEDDPNEPKLLTTVRGVGYKLEG